MLQQYFLFLLQSKHSTNDPNKAQKAEKHRTQGSHYNKHPQEDFYKIIQEFHDGLRVKSYE